MFDFETYYAKQNQAIDHDYERVLNIVRDIQDETRHDEGVPAEKKEYFRFFHHAANLILRVAEYERQVNNDYFNQKNFEELQTENKNWRVEILPENYATCYAEPTYAVSLFGDKYGQLIAFLYRFFLQSQILAFEHCRYKLIEINRLFIECFQFIKNNKIIDYDELKRLVTQYHRAGIRKENIIDGLRRGSDPEFRYYLDIVEKSDLSDLRYLFRYGDYITEDDIKTARFVQNYPEENIKRLSNQLVKAYLAGFQRGKKDVSKKSTVRIFYKVGYERLIRQLIQDLKTHHLEVAIGFSFARKANKQLSFDHKFDQALYFDENYHQTLIENAKEVSEEYKHLLNALSGSIIFETFGEPPFSPEYKEERIQFTPEQLKLFQQHQNELINIQNQYIPRSETSFTIISFPSPEIKGDFEQIFDDIFEINLVDSEKVEHVQQKIIDVLDKAEYVHVKGKGDNQTDIKVQLHKLGDPNTQTNFLNCGADINIPVGEVFTSPQLTNTNGILNFPVIHQDGLKYTNLHLVIKDGFVADYTCDNFENPDENKQYIEQNLLFPHKTLPIGEFAIGTNTLAYVKARQHDIVDVLPILIIEKMGPHFAIGDTCFSHAEDQAVFNHLDQKEIIARENEKSALRKTNQSEAYTSCHTDMTLPYEIIECITAVTSDGERIDILRDGRFVLAGTEELNKPLENEEW